jgi:hypothetical protein
MLSAKTATQEFLAFLNRWLGRGPRRRLHVICDNYATHRHPRVRAWLGKHPRVQLRFTPTSASWPNLVEVFSRSRSAKRSAVATSPASPTSSRRSPASAPPRTSAASRCLDQARRRDPRQAQPSNHLSDGALSCTPACVTVSPMTSSPGRPRPLLRPHEGAGWGAGGGCPSPGVLASWIARATVVQVGQACPRVKGWPKGRSRSDA